ncbi:hypothetical protein DINM_007145 [Dirofilaria immitis]|nr:hypothetical protein [Dirofilaria immitis]
MLKIQLLFIIISITIIWATESNENFPIKRSKRYERTYARPRASSGSNSRTNSRSDSSNAIPLCCIPKLRNSDYQIRRITTSCKISCNFDRPTEITSNIPDSTSSLSIRNGGKFNSFSSRSSSFSSYGYGRRNLIDSASNGDNINERLRTIMLEIPIPRIEFESHITTSHDISHEIPISREFHRYEMPRTRKVQHYEIPSTGKIERYETISSNIPSRTISHAYEVSAPISSVNINTYSSQRANSQSTSYRSVSYGRPSMINSRDTYVTETTKRSITSYKRPTTIIDSIEDDDDDDDFDQNPLQTEVIASDKINEIPNGQHFA